MMTAHERDAMLTRMDKSVGIIREHVTELDKYVKGNGRPGLLDRVQTVEVKQEECPARKAADLPNRRSLVANVIAVAALAAAIIGYFLK